MEISKSYCYLFSGAFTYTLYHLRLQVIVNRLGTGAIFQPKSGKYEWFNQRVLGTEWLTGHNLHQ